MGEPIRILVLAVIVGVCFWRFCIANGFLPFGEIIRVVRESARILWENRWLLYAYIILALASALLQESSRAFSEFTVRKLQPDLFAQPPLERQWMLSQFLYWGWHGAWSTASGWLWPSVPLSWSAWVPAILFFRFRAQIRGQFCNDKTVAESARRFLWGVVWIGVVASLATLPAPFVLTLVGSQTVPAAHSVALAVAIPAFLLTIGLSTLVLAGVITAAHDAPASHPRQLLRIHVGVFQRLLVFSVVASVVFLGLRLVCSNVLSILPLSRSRVVFEVQHFGLTYFIPALYVFLFPASLLIVLADAKPRQVVKLCGSVWVAHWRTLIALLLLWLTVAFGFALARQTSLWLARAMYGATGLRIGFGMLSAVASALSLVCTVRLLDRLGVLNAPGAAPLTTQ